MKTIIMIFVSSIYLFAHPVNYTINLEAKYDNVKQELNVSCNSNVRNKCGLHNFHLLDVDDKIIQTVRFPFLKEKTTVKNIETKPYKIIFFLRKVPEHTYTVLIE